MPNPLIRSTRIVLLALIAGLGLFLGVTVFLRWTQGPLGNADQLGALTLIVPLFYVAAAATCVVLSRKLVEAARQNGGENLELARQERMPSELQRAAILGAALAEGPGLLACVTVLLGGPWYLIALTVLSIGWIVFLIPTRERIEAMLRETH